MHELKLLVNSKFGMVHKCVCCGVYHLTVDNISIRLTWNQIVALSNLTTNAVGLNSFREFDFEKKSRIN
jgi:hypothetical protein